MTSRAELLKGMRTRGMLTGPLGTGKTAACVSTAEARARQGKRVLYVDLGAEDGARREMLSIPDEVLANINHRKPRSYRDAVKLFVPGAADFVVVDALQNLRTIAAEVTTAAMVAVGADMEKDDREAGHKEGALQRLMKQDGIAHPAILPFGKGTGQMKQYEASFFDRVFDMECDVLCALNPKSLGTTENYATALGGLFDVVVEMERIELPTRTWEYRFKVEKLRGVAFTDAKPRAWKRGEDLIGRIEEVMSPKPKVLLHCAECNKDIEPRDAKPCAEAKHNLGPVEVKA